MTNKPLMLFLVSLIITICGLSVVFGVNCGGDIACNCSNTVNASITLTANLSCNSSDGLIVGVNDTTIDCNGYSILYAGSGYYDGIFSSYKNNVTIKNCYIYNFSNVGIYAEYGANITITNVNLSTNNEGLRFSTVSGNIYISNVNIYSGPYDGLYYSQGNNDPSLNLTIIAVSPKQIRVNILQSIFNVSRKEIYF